MAAAAAVRKKKTQPVLTRWADRVEEQIEYFMDEKEKKHEIDKTPCWSTNEFQERVKILALCRIAEGIGKLKK